MAPRYGDFTFDSCCGFTGSAGKKPVKGYMRGGYAEGGMRSERTEEAKATRRVQDDAFAPARQLNKSLKNLNRVRKETGYGADEEMLESDRSRMMKAKGGMAKGGNWIAGAIKHKGALHRALGVPEGKKIPASKIEKATHSSNPKLAKRARLAQTLKSFHKG